MSNHCISSAIINLVDRLHQHGLSHGDLSERNILVRDGCPTLVDLEKVQPHNCDRKMLVRAGAIEPEVDEFGCEELHDVVRQMGFWAPSLLLHRLLIICSNPPTFLEAVHYCSGKILKSEIPSLAYLESVPSPVFLVDDEDQQNMHALAQKLYEAVLEERRLTYGVSELDRMSRSRAQLIYANIA